MKPTAHVTNRHPTGIFGQGVVHNTLSGYLILAWLMVLFTGLSLIPQTAQAASLTAGPPYSAVTSKRTSPTVLEATMKASVQNPGTISYADVTASLKVLEPRVTVVDGNLSFGPVAAGATVTSRDTFTVRLNTSMAIEHVNLVWTVTGRTVPVLANIPSQTITANSTLTLPLSATDADGDALAYSVAPALPNASINATSGVFTFTPTQAQIGTHTLTFTVSDGRYSATKTATITVTAPPYGDIPPDPATVAPAPNPTAITPFEEANAFLYSGANPIQKGVSPGAIVAKRAAVVRGLVLDKNNQPLPGAKVTIQGRPELGSTTARLDGMYDMVVNGGGYISVNVDLAGYLPVQRQLNVPWNDYAWADDVVMIKLDPVANPVDLTRPVMQTARGSSVTDSDGTRQATVLFPAGTQANLVMPDGSTQPLSQMTVRATEYTVGENGPKAMPGPLPPTSGYTYAVELSVDEAIAAGAKSVKFSQPVPFYVDNFLDFPVGGIVPIGWYDRDKSAWIPSDNGRVIKVLDIIGGLASLDVDGTGQAADIVRLAALGITDAERVQLASMYPAGRSLWRSPVSHFTPWDCNWPYGPPRNAKPPSPPKPPKVDKKEPKPDCEQGSIIECQNQTLGESVPIAGTPFTLNYRSNRVEDHKASYRIDIPLIGETVPDGLKRIDVIVVIAGKINRRSYPAAPNQSTEYVWDGNDANGRRMTSPSIARVKIGYVYDAEYQRPVDFRQSFGQVSGIPITANRARQEVVLWQSHEVTVGNWFSKQQGLAGWTITPQHRKLLVGKIEHGTAESQQVSGEVTHVSSIAAGLGSHSGYRGEGMLVTETDIESADGLAVGADGSLYFGQYRTIRRVDPEGKVTTIAGNGQRCDSSTYPCGDGGLATEATLDKIHGLAIDAEGNLYFTDSMNFRIRKINTKGIITTVAGSGKGCKVVGSGCTASQLGDGGPATAALLNNARGIAVAPDGVLYIADAGNKRIRKVDVSGVITTIAGTGLAGYSPDGELAANARLFLSPHQSGFAIGPDGSIYFSEDTQIRRISPDGILSTVAGNGDWIYQGDGILAIDAPIPFPNQIVAAPTGEVYFTDLRSQRVHMISSNGILRSYAGKGVSALDAYPGTYSFTKEMLNVGGSAHELLMTYPWDLAIGPTGQLYITDSQSSFIFKIAKNIDEKNLIASPDGRELYQFDGAGRHQRTLDARTLKPMYQFGYDATGYLTSITDADNNITRIERNGETPTAIIAPQGQRTELGVDANGYLNVIRNPAGETYQATYTAGGLLKSFTDPRGNTTNMHYDSLGRLVADVNAAGSGWMLSRSDNNSGYQVEMTTAMGRKTTYQIENLTTGEQRRTKRYPDGTQTLTQFAANGSETFTDVDGTVSQVSYSPDPRFGMRSAYASNTSIRLPSGLTRMVTSQRSASLRDSKDVLSLESETETVTINGKAYRRHYWNPTYRTTYLSPVGRSSEVRLNDKGRVAYSGVSSLTPTYYDYDGKGRLTALRQGEGAALRSARLSYNPAGLPATLTDAVGRVTSYEYDLAGRVTRTVLPGGRAISFSYDANGNLTSLVPPGRPAHRFSYTALDQTSAYTPPAVSNGGETLYEYNADKQLTKITRPDGQAIGYRYYAGGELGAMDTPAGTTQYGYTLAGGTGGHLNRIITPDGINLRYSYDGSLPLNETWSGPISGTVSRSWNNDFQLSRLSLNGAGIDYQYDADGLVTQAGSLALSYDQTAPQLLGATQGKVTSGFIYNNFNELAQQTTYVDGAVHYDVSYTRDALGRITGKTETIGGQTDSYGYRYDSAGRLTQVSKNGTVTGEYSYDANGNRVSAIGQTATHDDQDRLTNNSGAQYEYNANGELKRITAAGQVTDYQYDVLGNLRQVTLPDGTTIDYLIDGNNRRVGKKVNGALVQGLLYQDQLKPIAELDGNGNTVARFVYATKTNVPEYMVKGGETYRIVTDHLGSPRLVINTASGAIVQRIDYDEYGFVILDTNPGFQPFGYAGGLIDQHTKLVRFGARDYDPKVGRWTAKDPIRFEGGDTNLYGYVANDPVNWIDPTGHFGVVGAVVGGVVGGISGAVGAVATGGSLGDIATAAGVGAIGGAIVGSYPMGLIGEVVKGGLMGGLGDAAGQYIGMRGDPCRKFNVGSVIGAAVGSAAGAGRANVAGGAGPSALGQAVGGLFTAGIPSLIGGAVGTWAGR